MKALGWAIVASGLVLQYLLAADALPVPRTTWLGMPVGPLGMFVGLLLNWLGYIVLHVGFLGARTTELDREIEAMERARRSERPLS
jgi:hypothetical protein